ncbi:MAG: GGDEF domain-containing protein [Clostridiales bacterium]|nr:GGDEF domain-containing protein [Clostridiales bacterium]
MGEAAYTIAIAVEMLIVNAVVTDFCCQRKYRRIVNLLVYALASLPFALAALAILPRINYVENGNGLFAVLGFFFVFVTQMLYKDGMRKTVTVWMFSSVYTMIMYTVSVQLSKLIPLEEYAVSLLIVQSMLYWFSIFPLIYWIRSGLIFVLKNTADRINIYLLLISSTWFLAILFINLSLLYEYLIIRIVTLALLLLNVLWSYAIVYYLVRSNNAVETIKDVAYTDELTKLNNRVSLFEDVANMISKGVPFSLVYIDLNSFKSINDKYGHLVGDEYLKAFADNAKKILDEHGTLYRVAGDEFICIVTRGHRDAVCRKLVELNFKTKSGIEFLGCGAGASVFPKDSSSLDELIHIADEKMYRNKKEIKGEM